MPDIQLLLNVNRREKSKSAFRVFHTGMGLQFAEYAPEGDPTYYNNWRFGPMPDGLWREPQTGAIMLKPICHQVDRLSTTSLSYGLWVKSSDMNFAGTSAGYAGFLTYNASTGQTSPLYQGAKLILKTPADTFAQLSVDGQLGALTGGDTGMVWNVQMKNPLAPNQGWTAIISPHGIYGDQSGVYTKIAWGTGNGKRFCIEFQMDGVAVFKGWNGTSWATLYEFAISGAGVNHRLPFQVTVIPFAKRFIGVYFSQAAASSAYHYTSARTAVSFSGLEQGFLVILRGGSFEPYFDNPSQSWVKTGPGNLYIAIKASGYQYDFVLGTVGYKPSGAGFFTAPEFLPWVPTWSSGLSNKWTGISGQIDPSGAEATNLSVSLKNGNNETWANSNVPKNRVASAYVSMVPSGNGTNAGMYTPELWSLSLSYPANTQVTNYTQLDRSEFWSLIRFQRTTECDGGRIELKVLDDDRWQDLLLPDGPIQINAIDNSDNVVRIADGYTTRKEPGIEGGNQLTTEQYEGADELWTRANAEGCKTGAVEADLVVNVLIEGVKALGYVDADIEVDYTGSPELATMTFGKFVNPADVLQPNEDCSWGDFFRRVRDAFAVQLRPPLRIRKAGTKVKIYLGPIYTRGAAPDCTFVWDDSILNTVPVSSPITYVTEKARYAAKFFKAHGTFEPTILKPPFNSLIAKNSKGIGSDEGGDVAYIAPDPRVLTDPTFVGYQGYEDCKELSPQDLPMSSTTETLQQQIRAYWDLHYNLKALRTHEFSGEWQPEIDVDQFCCLLGKAKYADPGSRFAKGATISYGIYRIDFSDVEIRYDGPLDGRSVSRRWSWAGSYKLVFVDKDTWSGFPMWTTDSKLPLGAYGQ